MKLVTNKKQESYENAKICYIYKEIFEDKYAQDKRSCKFKHHCHYAGQSRSVAHSIYFLKYKIPKKITIVFDKESNYENFSKKSLQKNLKNHLLV